MKQKPSERIRELAKRQAYNGDLSSVSYDFPKGIMAYLDEEYERNKPCKEGCECVECDLARAEMPDAGSK